MRDDMDEHESTQARQRQEEFRRRCAAAAREAGGPEPTEEEIVEALKATREKIYHERYGAAQASGRP
jgi:hypothetical protein